VTIIADLMVLAAAVQQALRAEDQDNAQVTVFRPSKMAAPGDYAWVQPVSTDESKLGPRVFASSGELAFEVRVEFHTDDTQAAAGRITKMLDRSNPDCVQAHLYGCSIGHRVKIRGCSWGERTNQRGSLSDADEVYAVQARVNGVVLLTEAAAEAM